MEAEAEQPSEIVPVTPIRVETALSRFPIHRLAKHGDTVIDIREVSDDGEAVIRWEVSHNSKYGQPGPLAYKLDTLIINRRIEEASRPISKIIRLGSLRDICKELGRSEGEIKNTIKKALYQNAGAFITAKTKYRRSNGTEHTIEIGDTRYGVVFTGERLPDGRTADAVYVVLHDFYKEILDNAVTRPLDYDYLRDLPPIPQRFYEILSYSMYATLKNDRARARLVYSEFCTHAPQTRYMAFEQVKKQMHKIHTFHRKSGYIAKIDYEQTVDGNGDPDWIMFYMPGSKARAEYRTFTGREGMTVHRLESSPEQPKVTYPKPTQLDFPLKAPRRARAKPQPSPLEAELIAHGVSAAIAAELAQSHTSETITTQIEHLDWLAEKKPGKVSDPGAWLSHAIRTGIALPKGFVPKAERERRAEAKAAKEREAAQARRQEQERKARERAEEQAIAAYWAGLTPEEQKMLDAKAEAEADPEQLARERSALPALKRMGQKLRRELHIRQLLIERGELNPAE